MADLLSGSYTGFVTLLTLRGCPWHPQPLFRLISHYCLISLVQPGLAVCYVCKSHIFLFCELCPHSKPVPMRLPLRSLHLSRHCWVLPSPKLLSSLVSQETCLCLSCRTWTSLRNLPFCCSLVIYRFLSFHPKLSITQSQALCFFLLL